MAISTLCTGCRSLLRLPDELAGKQVRCQKCNQLFMVPGLLAIQPAKSPPTPPPAPPPAVSAPPPPTIRQSMPAADGLPPVVLVEVPVKAVPPPVPEECPAPERRPE